MALGITRCENFVHDEPRIHWTRKAQSACDAEQAEIDARISTEQSLTPHMRWDRSLRERELHEFEAKLATRTRRPARSSVEAALLRNAQRQLALVTPEGLQALDMLMTTDVYGINSRLRRGENVRVGPMLDWHGYSSGDMFLAQTTKLFSSLGDDLQLESPLTLYRGIALEEHGYDGEDIWHVRALLRDEITTLQDELEDPGFIFASPFASTALQHTGYSRRGAPWRRVLFELTVHGGMCLPDPDIGSDDHLRRMQPHRFLSKTSSQIVIPRQSRWTMQESHPDLEDETLLHVRLEQID